MALLSVQKIFLVATEHLSPGTQPSGSTQLPYFQLSLGGAFAAFFL